MNLFILVFISIGAALGSLFYIKSALMSLFKGGINNMLTGEVPLIEGGSSGKSKVEFLKDKPKAQDPSAVNQTQATESLQPSYMMGTNENSLNGGVANIHTNGMQGNENGSDNYNELDESQEEENGSLRKIKGYINQTGQFFQPIRSDNLVLNQSDSQVVNLMTDERNINEPIPLGGNLFSDTGNELDQGENNVEELKSIMEGSLNFKSLPFSVTGYNTEPRHFTGPKVSELKGMLIYNALLNASDSLLESGHERGSYNNMIEQPGFGKMMKAIMELNPKASAVEIASILLLSNQMYAENSSSTRGKGQRRPISPTGVANIGEQGDVISTGLLTTGKQVATSSSSLGSLTEEEARKQAIENYEDSLLVSSDNEVNDEEDSESAEVVKVEVKPKGKNVAKSENDKVKKVEVNLSDETIKKIGEAVKDDDGKKGSKTEASKRLHEKKDTHIGDGESPMEPNNDAKSDEGNNTTNLQLISREAFEERKGGDNETKK